MGQQNNDFLYFCICNTIEDKNQEFLIHKQLSHNMFKILNFFYQIWNNIKKVLFRERCRWLGNKLLQTILISFGKTQLFFHKTDFSILINNSRNHRRNGVMILISFRMSKARNVKINFLSKWHTLHFVKGIGWSISNVTVII